MEPHALPALSGFTDEVGDEASQAWVQNHVFAVAIRAIQEQAVDADPRVVTRAVARALSELKTQPHSSVALVSQESMSDLAANFKVLSADFGPSPQHRRRGRGGFIGSLRGSQASHGQNRLSFPTFGFVQIVEAPTRCFPERIRAREEPHPRFCQPRFHHNTPRPPFPHPFPKLRARPIHTQLSYSRVEAPRASHT